MKKRSKVLSVILTLLLVFQLVPGVTVGAYQYDYPLPVHEVEITPLTIIRNSGLNIPNVQKYADASLLDAFYYASDSFSSYVSGNQRITCYVDGGRKYGFTVGYDILQNKGDGSYTLNLPSYSYTLYDNCRFEIYLPLADVDGAPEGIEALCLVSDNSKVVSSRNVLDCFEWTLADSLMITQENAGSMSQNIYKYVPVLDVQTSLAYASDYYDGNISTNSILTFENDNYYGSFSITDIPLKRSSRYDYYLYLPLIENVPNGTYKLTIELPIADGKETEYVKPIVFTINNYEVKLTEDHSDHYDEGKISLEPTEDIPGQMMYTCTCGRYIAYIEEIPPMNDPMGHEHTPSDIWEVGIEPTCETEGWQHLRCMTCGEIMDRMPIPPTDHSFSEWIYDEDMDSPYYGMMVRTCHFCGYAEFDNPPVDPEPPVDPDPEPDPVLNNTVFVISDTETLNPISGAHVYVIKQDGSVSVSGISDSDGIASVELENGAYSVQIVANGYMMRNFVIEKTDDDAEYNVYLGKNSILDLSTNVKEMTYEEIIDAGIDVNSSQNQHVYKCVTVLQFTPVISGGNSDVDFEPIDVEFDYVYDNTGTVINPKPIVIQDATIYPLAKDIFLIIHSSVTWLKEMFDVQLVMANTSSIETIEDAIANLVLPEGLSLAVMTDKQQSLSVNVPDILPNETYDVHWYLAGDKEGEYYLNGTVTANRVGGGIVEEINNAFATTEPINVLAGNAMKLTIEAEKYATAGAPYQVKYTLQNVSGKTLNNVELNVLGGKFCKAYDVENMIYDAIMGDTSGLAGSFNDGYVLKDAKFKSGEILSGVFEITFGTGITTEYIEYMVSDMFTFTGNGSTTVIPTEIILVDDVVPHRWDEGRITKKATCTGEGTLLYRCTDTGCRETYTVSIPATGHIYGDWVVTEESTCTTEGVKKRACTECGHTMSLAVTKTEHKWDSGKIVVRSTQSEKGSIKYTCKSCKATKTDEIPLVKQTGSFDGNDGASWSLYENGMILIEGEGGVISSGASPWEEVSEVRIEEGITKIGEGMFDSFENLKSIIIPESVKEIGADAFKDCDSVRNIFFEGGRKEWEEIAIADGNTSLDDMFIRYKKPSMELDSEKVQIYAPEEYGKLLVVSYFEGKLIDNKFIDIKSSVEKTIEELGLDTANADEVKVFLWKDMFNLIPLCLNESISLSTQE